MNARRVDHNLGKPTIPEIGGAWRQPRDCHLRRGSLFAQVNLIPIDAEVGDDSNLSRSGKELAGEIHHDALRLARRDSHVFDNGLPSSSGIFDLEIGKDQTVFALLSGSEESAAVGPIDPSAQHENRPVVWHNVAEFKIESV